MRKFFGGLPPRYPELLRLTLFAALLRLVPLLPAALAYALLPVGSWLRLILLFCPVLWVWLVCPARVRYGEMLAAFAKDASAPLHARALLGGGTAWRGVCKGRLGQMRRYALPLFALLAVLALLFFVLNPFAALHIVLAVFGSVAAVLGTVAAFLPRLLMGEAIVQPGGVLGGLAVLAVVLILFLLVFAKGAFRTSGYRFGRTAERPQAAQMLELRKKNLRLWLPTLALGLVLLVFFYRELGLLAANALGAAPLFSVRPGIAQLVLMGLTAVSYLAFLPVRKYRTAVWAQQVEQEEA